ncbi:MAG: septum formation initiator family protein [Candidatus Omnitrophica bacterium]|nr:septum formation initiator family protein [Candidatus Omnitrophota bacterium]
MGSKKIIVRLILVLVVLSVIFLPGYSKLQKLRAERAEQNKRIQLLKEHNEKMKTELGKMQDDPEYVEKKARNKLGIVKKGEVIYRRGTSHVPE